MPPSFYPADPCLDVPLVPEDFLAVARFGASEGGARPPGALQHVRHAGQNWDSAQARPEGALHPFTLRQIALRALLALKTI